MSEIKPSDSIAKYTELLINYHSPYCGHASKQPVVSIISSFYNAQRHFEETFITVMNQTLQNFEWIIVDDCSTDKTAIALFESLKQRSGKIKTLRHRENRGLAAGRNTAISQAQGKYLFFIDLDDLIDATYLEKCALFLELHPEFSFVNSFTVGFQEQEYWWTNGFEKSPDFIEQNWVTTMLMHRKSDFDALGGFDERLRFYEDWERWLKALCAGQKGWTIPEFLHCYRRTESGLLSASIFKDTEERKIKNQIKSSYEEKFRLNPPTKPKLTLPAPYEVENLRRRPEIENNLEWSGKGKKILFLFPHFEVGGADKFNLDLIQMLADNDYAITIATTLKSLNPWQKHFYEITPDIFHLTNYSYDINWVSILRYLIESRAIDIVFVSNSYFAYYMVPMLRAEFPEVAFVDFVHACDPGWRIDGYPRVSRQFSNFFDAQMVTSGHLSNYNYQRNPYAQSPPSACYINIDTDKWSRSDAQREKIRRQFNIDDETALILFPVRLTPQKRPELFAKIIQKLAARSLPVKAIVLGDGMLLQSFAQLIRKLNLTKVVQILPPVSPEEMIEFYSAADILLLPSEYEGISLVIYEAMAMQLPVVASDVGGQRELVIEGTGFLVEKGNGDEMEIENYTKVLAPLIENPNLRKQIGKAARQRVVESFSLDLMCKNVEKVFEEAIKNRREKPPEKVNIQLAEELLILTSEDAMSEGGGLTHLVRERDELRSQKAAMEDSRFWKARNHWFKVKRKLGIIKN
jgi:glycosyltransferase involved in cell wall biosynthesis